MTAAAAAWTASTRPAPGTARPASMAAKGRIEVRPAASDQRRGHQHLATRDQRAGALGPTELVRGNDQEIGVERLDINRHAANRLYRIDDEKAAMAANDLGAKIEVPTLICWGEKDVALEVSTLDGVDQYVRDVKIVRLPKASHWVQQEAPARVNAMRAKWMGDRGLAPAGPAR